MTPDDAITRILDRLRTSLDQITVSVNALGAEESCGESAAGSVKVVFNPLGELKRVEIDPSFLHGAGRRRVEEALLEAFREAERAADAARADFARGLEFMGVPIGQALQDGSIVEILPDRRHISRMFQD
ncbi:YbaB/EbfC family nucleoid-associated protein [Actinoallomurus sp. NPDC052308]|uniref:YbaB/EbfC family nucleoid-associated protein n=1 Tax=Actinoallomurus sp. NPDC052308 TaxID=3155530 RepID=UPI003433B98F